MKFFFVLLVFTDNKTHISFGKLISENELVNYKSSALTIFSLAFQEGSGRFLDRHEKRNSNLRTDVYVFVATKEEKYISLK